MAGASIGQVETFNAGWEWIEHTYLERAELFPVPVQWQVQVFLTLVGGQTYSLLRDLLSLEKPADNTLKQHYEPKKVIASDFISASGKVKSLWLRF